MLKFLPFVWSLLQQGMGGQLRAVTYLLGSKESVYLGSWCLLSNVSARALRKENRTYRQRA